ncbi:hypothetical protein KZZ52_02065 [Dactylosporangium sp. AC04546]|uniref:hypothetical protein n=1 Tax=Dactylosporangium sp. AC04546 TaxID=2862460 RepID=UPI001EDD5789|nr:hypothetical protein [Dactylosporangium sp. AC04546]WVK84245.1 hypothetical protein KZZ52_02065 [Dactylosporangium sp. AC04546]
MPVSEGLDGAQRCGELLRELLTTVPRYRRRWQTQVRRNRSDDLSQAAVAEVLALHLWDTGERDDGQTTLARDLKDRVRRTLSGRGMSAQTLTWLIAAFDMTDQHAGRLWAAYSGDDSGQRGVAHTFRTVRPMIRPQRHRTISLFERYRIGADGALIDRHTWHTIIAVADGVGSFVFNHEPLPVTVDVILGGEVGQHYHYGGGLESEEIVLNRTLRRGDTAAVEYLTTYPPCAAQLTEIRRPARGRSENVDIAVAFDTAHLPTAVWWCVWDDHLENAPVREEPASPEDGVVHRFLPFIEQTAVGFRWQW